MLRSILLRIGPVALLLGLAPFHGHATAANFCAATWSIQNGGRAYLWTGPGPITVTNNATSTDTVELMANRHMVGTISPGGQLTGVAPSNVRIWVRDADPLIGNGATGTWH